MLLIDTQHKGTKVYYLYKMFHPQGHRYIHTEVKTRNCVYFTASNVPSGSMFSEIVDFTLYEAYSDQHRLENPIRLYEFKYDNPWAFEETVEEIKFLFPDAKLYQKTSQNSKCTALRTTFERGIQLYKTYEPFNTWTLKSPKQDDLRLTPESIANKISICSLSIEVEPSKSHIMIPRLTRLLSSVKPYRHFSEVELNTLLGTHRVRKISFYYYTNASDTTPEKFVYEFDRKIADGDKDLIVKFLTKFKELNPDVVCIYNHSKLNFLYQVCIGMGPQMKSMYLDCMNRNWVNFNDKELDEKTFPGFHWKYKVATNALIDYSDTSDELDPKKALGGLVGRILLPLYFFLTPQEIPQVYPWRLQQIFGESILSGRLELLLKATGELGLSYHYFSRTAIVSMNLTLKLNPNVYFIADTPVDVPERVFGGGTNFVLEPKTRYQAKDGVEIVEIDIKSCHPSHMILHKMSPETMIDPETIYKAYNFIDKNNESTYLMKNGDELESSIYKVDSVIDGKLESAHYMKIKDGKSEQIQKIGSVVDDIIESICHMECKDGEGKSMYKVYSFLEGKKTPTFFLKNRQGVLETVHRKDTVVNGKVEFTYIMKNKVILEPIQWVHSEIVEKIQTIYFMKSIHDELGPIHRVDCFIDEKSESIHFMENKEGVLTRKLKYLLHERDQAKSKLKEYIGEDEKKHFSVIEKCLKLWANCEFGNCGSQSWRTPLTCVPIAAAVTTNTTATFKNIKSFLESNGHTVIYGITDSFFVLTKNAKDLAKQLLEYKDKYGIIPEIKKNLRAVATMNGTNWIGIDMDGQLINKNVIRYRDVKPFKDYMTKLWTGVLLRDDLKIRNIEELLLNPETKLYLSTKDLKNRILLYPKSNESKCTNGEMITVDVEASIDYMCKCIGETMEVLKYDNSYIKSILQALNVQFDLKLTETLIVTSQPMECAIMTKFPTISPAIQTKKRDRTNEDMVVSNAIAIEPSIVDAAMGSIIVNYKNKKQKIDDPL